MPHFQIGTLKVDEEVVLRWSQQWEVIWQREKQGGDDDAYIPIYPYHHRRCVMDISLEYFKSLEH